MVSSFQYQQISVHVYYWQIIYKIYAQMQELKETTYEKTDTRKNTEEPSEVKMPCIRKPLRFMFS